MLLIQIGANFSKLVNSIFLIKNHQPKNLEPPYLPFLFFGYTGLAQIIF
jgi:hypothetical protein